MNTSSIAPATTEDTQQLVELFAAMNTATQAADERMAAESNKTFVKFFEMMEAMQGSMKGTAAEMHSLRERLEASEQRNKELEALRQAEKRAAEERTSTLEAKVDALSLRLTESERTFANHQHKMGYCCPHTASLGYNCGTYPFYTQGPVQPEKK